MQVIRGVHCLVFLSEVLRGGRGAVGEQPGEARPEGCVVVVAAAHGREAWAQRAWERCAPA